METAGNNTNNTSMADDSETTNNNSYSYDDTETGTTTGNYDASYNNEETNSSDISPTKSSNAVYLPLTYLHHPKLPPSTKTNNNNNNSNNNNNNNNSNNNNTMTSTTSTSTTSTTPRQQPLVLSTTSVSSNNSSNSHKRSPSPPNMMMTMVVPPESPSSISSHNNKSHDGTIIMSNTSLVGRNSNNKGNTTTTTTTTTTTSHRREGSNISKSNNSTSSTTKQSSHSHHHRRDDSNSRASTSLSPSQYYTETMMTTTFSDATNNTDVSSSNNTGSSGVGVMMMIRSQPLRARTLSNSGGGGGGTSSHHNSNKSNNTSTTTTTTTNNKVMYTTYQEGDEAGVDDEDEEEENNNNDGTVELSDPSPAFNFMMEHRIFLRAALNLLTERDRHAPELGMMDPIILKSGPLKKASHLMNGVWKVKYVEIRRGMFSYYENAVSNKQSSHYDKDSTKDGGGGNGGYGEPGFGGELLRKNIPLEASTVNCRAVKLHQKALAFSPTGAIFELAYQNNNTKRLWMANSREERSVWIQAINNAMVGGSVTRGDDTNIRTHSGLVRNVNTRSPFKDDLKKYLKAQTCLRNAKTRQDYLTAVRDHLIHLTLQIPVKWIIAKQAGENNSTNSNYYNNNNYGSHDAAVPDKAFQEETVALSIDQLWRDLARDMITIDGTVYRGDALHGPERILGALTQQILTVAGNKAGSSGSRSFSDLRESQALVYARDILLAGNRTRSAGDSYYCVNTLCSNPELVVVVPASGTEVSPVAFEVSEDDSDQSFQNRFIDKSGWIKTRNKLQRGWRKQFFVLSEGTLSYYQGALPRPHGLRGQRVMKDATISITKKPARTDGKAPHHDQFILKISLDDTTTKDRMLLFESEDKLFDWVYALECVTKSGKKAKRRRSLGNSNNSNHNNNNNNNNNNSSNNNNNTNTTDKSEEMYNNNSQSMNNNPPSSMIEILKKAEEATKKHAIALGIDTEGLEGRLATYAGRATSAVRVSVRACTEYKVCTLDPEGDEENDTWANITSEFQQSFRVTGGPNGRIMRGEETVRVSVIKCPEVALDSQGAAGALPDGQSNPLSPTSSMRSRINRRIFRNFGSNEDILEGDLAAENLD